MNELTSAVEDQGSGRNGNPRRRFGCGGADEPDPAGTILCLCTLEVAFGRTVAEAARSSDMQHGDWWAWRSGIDHRLRHTAARSRRRIKECNHRFASRPVV